MPYVPYVALEEQEEEGGNRAVHHKYNLMFDPHSKDCKVAVRAFFGS